MERLHVLSRVKPHQQDLLAGWASGCASVTVGFPLDTIKTNMQINSTGIVASVKVRRVLMGMAIPLASGVLTGSIMWTWVPGDSR
jgi:hypothetical protein